MTCQEFRKLFDKSPADCTTAEVAAVRNHGRTCDSCFIFAVNRIKNVSFIPEEIAKSNEIGNEAVERVRNDPETNGSEICTPGNTRTTSSER